MPQPVSWWRVVKASVKLNKLAALVWDEYRFRDNGAGAWPKVELVGRMCGCSPRTVEGIRGDLQRFGMLQPERMSTKTHWHVLLPEGCYPTSPRPTDDEVAQLARRLDQHLASFEPGGTTPTSVAPAAERRPW